MSVTKFSFEAARQIPIVDYLSRLGFEPAKVRGTDHWYHSPFREERAPSFKVNARLNLWFDHGTGAGGSIIDLGMKLFSCSPHEFLQRLYSDNKDMAGSMSSAIITSLTVKPAASFPTPSKLTVLQADTLNDKDLIQYLNSRGIQTILAKQYCKQIHFRMNEREYTAIGFPNQSGAWELRNRWFKGSSSPKDISIVRFSGEYLKENKNHNTIDANSKICVLEGFMDFLSVVQIKDEGFQKFTHQSDFLILNSLRLLSRNLQLLQAHQKISLFLDNDQPAQDARAALIVKGIRYEDASTLYRPHKDVNDFLIAKGKTKNQSDNLSKDISNSQLNSQSLAEDPGLKPLPQKRRRTLRM
ncbi:MAG TPA: toprim domain-containing protein [Cyclobacteriaceae bacterium]|nr:toprim domain-containing protein [Cyclobacteriaceae bacterium]